MRFIRITNKKSLRDSETSLQEKVKLPSCISLSKGNHENTSATTHFFLCSKTRATQHLQREISQLNQCHLNIQDGKQRNHCKKKHQMPQNPGGTLGDLQGNIATRYRSISLGCWFKPSALTFHTLTHGAAAWKYMFHILQGGLLRIDINGSSYNSCRP